MDLTTFLLLLAVFLIGAWAGTKWPSTNVIARVVG